MEFEDLMSKIYRLQMQKDGAKLATRNF